VSRLFWLFWGAKGSDFFGLHPQKSQNGSRGMIRQIGSQNFGIRSCPEALTFAIRRLCNNGCSFDRDRLVKRG
jgi:hypothetical protein